MIRILVPALCAGLLLAGCGGGTGDAAGQAASPQTPSQDAVPTMRLDAAEIDTVVRATGTLTQDNTPPTYDPQADRFVFAPKAFSWFASGEVVLTRVSDDMMPAGFEAYNDGSSRIRGVRGATAGGAAHAIRREADGFYMGYDRFGPTELPTTGRGVFTGTYAGTLGTTGAENLGTIKGLVVIQVDFAGRDVAGVISERINQNDRAFDPVVLQPTRMDNGTFSGNTSGGRSPFLGHQFVRGPYSGAIVGATGSGIVGTIDLRHTSSTTREDIVEAGAFVAERR